MNTNDKNSEESAPTPGEPLSRLMDEELGEFELRRLLVEVDSNPDQQLATWHRYHAVRAVLRGESPALGAHDLSGAVREAVAGEPAHAAADLAGESSPVAAPRRSAWGSVAIAASVMLAVVLLVRSIDSGRDAAVPEVAQGSVAGSGTIARAPAPAPTPVRSAEEPVEIIRAQGIELPPPERRPQPNVYLVRHAEFSTFAGSGAMMPYARVTTTESAD